FLYSYKGVPHKSEWIEGNDTGAGAQHVRAPPTRHQRGGTPVYTVPILVDPRTETALTDSLPLTLALERVHPDMPTLFPPGSEDTIAMFDPTVMHSVVMELTPMVILRMHAQLVMPTGSAFSHRSREHLLHGRLE
ncbi:hypothetical protein BC834DRAFT_836046, partial [Gloeopeniophorella convolvens]